ncbi:hypothetical protein M408DRAFT_329144 [Serendipita vermifera MAFF 305830]|uniref:Uncharacterized protein n=1 Tax=Serendipita vermifera MAFF 305830 TaxID=933852 RepID=A0A0C2XHW2_SERVB|nr:hypothetical protein M408DRAFT_329144 [Serendipita vermifera MAFF 305830]
MSDQESGKHAVEKEHHEHNTEGDHSAEEVLHQDPDSVRTEEPESSSVDDHDQANRRDSDPLGKLRGKSEPKAVKSGNKGGSRPSGGLKKESESESEKSTGSNESHGEGEGEHGQTKKKGKTRGKPVGGTSKGGSSGQGGLPGGQKR